MSNNTKNSILEIQDLSCGYGSKSIIEGFNLHLGQGEIVAVTGPNGCGKSTLLKAIYQLCNVQKGSIHYKAHNLAGKTPEQVKALGIAYFMQKNAIFPRLTVKENLFLSLNGMTVTQKSQKVEEILTAFPTVGEWLKKTAGLLSGGQRQQLSLAMLIAQDADLWLLDEPTAGLDSYKTDFFIETIKTQHKAYNKTIIIVEHKPYVISILASRCINFNNN